MGTEWTRSIERSFLIWLLPITSAVELSGRTPQGTHSIGDQGVWDCTNLASTWLPAIGIERYLPKRDQAFPDADSSPGFSGCTAFLPVWAHSSLHIPLSLPLS